MVLNYDDKNTIFFCNEATLSPKNNSFISSFVNTL